MIRVSFSWDDGALEDLKLMDLALKYKMPGMFFIPAINNERRVMNRGEIMTLSGNNFEIGSHTYSHIYLTQLPIKKAEDEIVNGKNYLQDLLGKEILHFCFPGGKSNTALIDFSKRHFNSARTADTGSFVNIGEFLIKPTFHLYNRGKKSLFYHSLINTSLFQTTIKHIKSNDYFNLIQSIIQDLASSNKQYNILIWGHSWEIEKYNYWKKLEELFAFINSQPGIEKTLYSNLSNRAR
jgi:peptidoglycan/xylan/chitin deacetylase (PgdA/CDA1 family)